MLVLTLNDDAPLPSPQPLLHSSHSHHPSNLLATYRSGCCALEFVWHDLGDGGTAASLVADPVLRVLCGITTVPPQRALVLQ